MALSHVQKTRLLPEKVCTLNWRMIHVCSPKRPEIQRHEKNYAKRTSVERTLKRILVDYDIENLRLRAEKRWFWFATLAGINQHLDAQIAVLKQPLFTKLGLISRSA